MILEWPDYRPEVGAIVIGPSWDFRMKLKFEVGVKTNYKESEIRIALFTTDISKLSCWKCMP
jgi:hypothetical protein